MTKSTKTNHYTYIIRHINGRYYVGRRSTKKDPALDPYMGSGNWVKSIKDRSTLTKTIIAYYDTFGELKVGEMELIEKYFDDEYCMNVMYSSCGASSESMIGDKNHMYGKTHTLESKQLMSDAKSGELNHSYGRTGDKHPMFGKTGDKCYWFGKTGELNPNYGLIRSDETRQKLSDAKSGENHPNATVTEIIVKLILIRIAEGVKDKSIQEEFNTTRSVVSGIRYKLTWKHITI